LYIGEIFEFSIILVFALRLPFNANDKAIVWHTQLLYYYNNNFSTSNENKWWGTRITIENRLLVEPCY
jgi:hypothetical protein